MLRQGMGNMGDDQRVTVLFLTLKQYLFIEKDRKHESNRLFRIRLMHFRVAP